MNVGGLKVSTMNFPSNLGKPEKGEWYLKNRVYTILFPPLQHFFPHRNGFVKVELSSFQESANTFISLSDNIKNKWHLLGGVGVVLY